MPDSVEIRRETRLPPTVGMVPDGGAAHNGREPSLGTLVRQLADDSRVLLRQEVDLAKVEIRDSIGTVARSAVLLGVGMGMLLVAGLVLVAFLVLALGRLLDGQYWLSSLIVGGLLALVGGAALLAGQRALQRSAVTPRQTVESLRANAEWAKREARRVRSGIAT